MAHDGGREAEQDGQNNQQRDLLFGTRPQARRFAAAFPGTQAEHDLGGGVSNSREPQNDGARGALFGEQREGRCGVGGGWTAPETGVTARQGGPFEDDRQQQQQQELSWAQVRGNIDVAARQRGLRSAYESVEVGRETLEHLDGQKERLGRSEMMLDSTRYAIERSARVLRGMNFWGRIRNALSDEPQVPLDCRSLTAAGQLAAATAHEQTLDDSPVEGFVCPDCRVRFDAAEALVSHFGSEHTHAGAGTDGGVGVGAVGGGSTPTGTIGAQGVDPQDFVGRGEGGRSGGVERERGENDDFPGNDVAVAGYLKDQLFDRRRDNELRTGETAGNVGGGWSGGVGVGRGGGVIAEQKAFMAAQDDYLDSVGKAVAELGLLGRSIGASLEGQGDTIERVVAKTEESNDRAAFVTRKAARQAQSSKPKKPTFTMSVALQEVSTGLFLTVTGDEVVLQETELRNVCRFGAWQRQDGIVGFKSGVTGRWLGQTFLGYLRVSGTRFGKNFEWQADLKRQETTMVCCSANWGAGGYLSVRPNPDNSSSRSDAPNSSPPAHDTAAAAAGYADPSAVRRAELGLVDATLANRSRAAVFRVVNCDGYTPQPFVGGRLMRKPEAPPGGGASGSSGGAGGGWGTGFKEELGRNR